MTFQDPSVARLVAMGGGGIPGGPMMSGIRGPAAGRVLVLRASIAHDRDALRRPAEPFICEHCVEQAHAMLLGSGGAGGRSAPEDPDRARAEIFDAFANINTIGGPDGADLPFVEHGEGLARYQEQAAARHPGIESVFVADHVLFLSASLAEVHFRITGTIEMPFVGAAVVHAGRWKVARDTVASLLSRAGVFIPPRAA